MTIKIAMIADYPDPGAPIDGGVQAVASYLVDAMVELEDISLTVISFRLGLNGTTRLDRAGFTQILMPYGLRGTLTGYLNDQAVLDKCLAELQPDIVHSQGAGHHGILASRSAYPSVITIHGIQSREAAYFSGLRRRLRLRIQAWLSSHYCIRQATYTILISPYVEQHYGDALKGQHFLIPNPIASGFFDVKRDPQPDRILFLGRVYAIKGVRDLVSAVAQLPGELAPTTVLAGSLADTQYVSQLRDDIDRAGLTDRFELPGGLGLAELRDELSRCTCLVLPAYQETAPMVVQEAMAAGVPVIASRICGLPYQVDEDKTGLLFTPGNVEELASHLRRMLTDEDMRKEFGRAAKEKAIREFRAEAVARQTLEVYKTVLGKT